MYFWDLFTFHKMSYSTPIFLTDGKICVPYFRTEYVVEIGKEVRIGFAECGGLEMEFPS